MTFDKAMAHVLFDYGHRVGRKDWNRPLYIECVWLTELQSSQIIMTMRNGDKGAYTPSQCDMKADDWVLIPSK